MNFSLLARNSLIDSIENTSIVSISMVVTLLELEERCTKVHPLIVNKEYKSEYSPKTSYDKDVCLSSLVSAVFLDHSRRQC